MVLLRPLKRSDPACLSHAPDLKQSSSRLEDSEEVIMCKLRKCGPSAPNSLQWAEKLIGFERALQDARDDGGDDRRLSDLKVMYMFQELREVKSSHYVSWRSLEQGQQLAERKRKAVKDRKSHEARDLSSLVRGGAGG